MRVLCLTVLLCASLAFAKPPKLTLFISVDALGSDLFWRMKPRFRAGLLQLSTQGAYFPTAKYDYAETVTAAGHATLCTGTNPARHGIVSNRVFNRQTGYGPQPSVHNSAFGQPRFYFDPRRVQLAARLQF